MGRGAKGSRARCIVTHRTGAHRAHLILSFSAPICASISTDSRHIVHLVIHFIGVFEIIRVRYLSPCCRARTAEVVLHVVAERRQIR